MKEKLLGYSAGLFLKILGMSWRYVRRDWENNELLKKDSPVIYAFWHGEQLMFPRAFELFAKRFKRREIYTLISAHQDGRIIANAIDLFGLHSVKGSSSRRGGQALLELVRKLKEGHDVAFTPDGPRGPAQVAKSGAIEASRLSGVPILPIGCAAKRAWFAKSWDRMVIPTPFSEIACVIGEPILGATEEILTEAINKVSKEARACFMK
jgi:lysophospholipid acyltransferase (LPLAT)-like uncharacterized protein